MLRRESVWDYPRPPAVEPFAGHVRIAFGGVTIVNTTDAWRVLETSHPPVYYVPPDAVTAGILRPAQGGTYCEWKGRARYFDVVSTLKHARRAAWSYPTPTQRYAPIANYVAFYAGPMDGCWVNGERVVPQPGGFYGGWITANLIGPFKAPAESTRW